MRPVALLPIVATLGSVIPAHAVPFSMTVPLPGGVMTAEVVGPTNIMHKRDGPLGNAPPVGFGHTPDLDMPAAPAPSSQLHTKRLLDTDSRPQRFHPPPHRQDNSQSTGSTGSLPGLSSLPLLGGAGASTPSPDHISAADANAAPNVGSAPVSSASSATRLVGSVPQTASGIVNAVPVGDITSPATSGLTSGGSVPGGLGSLGNAGSVSHGLPLAGGLPVGAASQPVVQDTGAPRSNAATTGSGSTNGRSGSGSSGSGSGGGSKSGSKQHASSGKSHHHTPPAPVERRMVKMSEHRTSSTAAAQEYPMKRHSMVLDSEPILPSQTEDPENPRDPRMGVVDIDSNQKPDGKTKKIQETAATAQHGA
ncbi:hypothetical protein K474DRAFT_371176 [Panus rudis PR-1116 ss-1]|nr:hypothetical protein K474DRAFT_371176 [Panus rudis PR-1116 ss-1]